MKLKFLLIVIFFIININLIFSQEAVSGIDRNLQNLKLSGFLRIRQWDYYSVSALAPVDPSKTSKPAEQADYADLFFRNRINLQVHPMIEIRSVFDIGTLHLGQNNDTGLGTGGVNIKTRDVYMNFKLFKSAELQAGLLPFSFPEGHILAKDAAGVQYRHRLWRDKFQPYFYWIKAVENSLPDAGKFGDFENHNFNDTDIYAIGADSILPGVSNASLYFIYMDDRENGTSSGTVLPRKLFWSGLHLEYLPGNWIWKLIMIGNFGIKNRIVNNLQQEYNVKAGLLQFAAGYRFGDFEVKLENLAATGDPADKDAPDSFQSIGPSVGLSHILLDDSGGLMIRDGGSAYGLSGTGLSLTLVLLGTLSVKTAWYHFLALAPAVSGIGYRNFGEEWNLTVNYLIFEKISFFSEWGIFMPGPRYSVVMNYHRQQPIYEFMFGSQVSY